MSDHSMVRHHLSRYRAALAVLLALALGVGSLVIGGSAAQARSAALTVPKLANAPVPSLCGHPAGRLVNGTLPGIDEYSGGVWLDKSKVAFGKLRKGQRRSAAAVIDCNQGGVGWPENVVVYSPKLKVIGTFRLGDITGGAREQVRRIWIRDRVVHVQVVAITAPDDVACCGTWSAKLRLKWSEKKGRVVVASKRVYRERPVAVKLVRAVEAGKRKVALRYGSRIVVDDLLEMRRAGIDFTVAQCYGQLSDTTWIFDVTDRYARGCVLDVRYRTGGKSLLAIYAEANGWNSYRFVDYRWAPFRV